jgi:hypothetical protein
MASKTFRHSPRDSNFSEVVVKEKVAYLKKNCDDRYTEIHLDNGTVIISEDSLNTLEARLESED